jgi:hypothetical protein
MKKIVLTCLIPFFPLLLVSLKTGLRERRGADVAVGCGPDRNRTGSDVFGRPDEERMRQLSDRASAKEKDLIDALAEKYSDDTTDSRRPALNRAYSRHMKELIDRYPEDPDIKALYIDGVMIEHAWDMWDPDGTPRAWTPELVSY